MQYDLEHHIVQKKQLELSLFYVDFWLLQQAPFNSSVKGSDIFEPSTANILYPYKESKPGLFST